jgi:serine/threonine protein kinase
MSKSIVIGEGTYGCVHKPSLLCQNKPNNLNYNDKISKILHKNDADDELIEFNNIKKIDPNGEFHSGTPIQCSPLDDKKQRSYIRKCNNKTFKNALKIKNGQPTPLSDNLSLLIMKDGGLDLRQFIREFSRNEPNTHNDNLIKKFFIEFERAFIGLRSLEDDDYVHNDIKLDNMVYNKNTNRLNFIDFGLTSKYSSIKYKGARDEYYVGDVCHWSFPPEIIFINSSKFKSVNRALKSNKKMHDIRDKYFYRNSYGTQHTNWASFALSDIYPNNTGSSVTDYNNIRTNQLFETLKYIKTCKYHDFLVKAIYTIDSYGVGMALSNATHKFKKFLNRDLFNDLVHISDIMTNWDITKRKDCHQLTQMYQNILHRNGLLIENNLQISISDLPTIIPIPKNEITAKKNVFQIPRVRSDAIRPETPPDNLNLNLTTVSLNSKSKSKSKTKSKTKTKTKSNNTTRRTRITDNYSATKIWKGQELRNRLFSLQGKPEKKGNANSGKFKNLALIRAEIRRIEKEKGKLPKYTPTPIYKN